MADLVALGELLIDFVPPSKGQRLRHVAAFEKAAGGAPANVAAGFSRLGGKSAFVGKVGNDEFGHFLRETLAAAGVDTGGLLQTDEALTGLAFVSLRDDGERDFLFYRHPAADMLLRPAEVPVELIDRARLFHFGSVSLIAGPAREATLAAASYAQERGKLVSYDPNLRLPLWPSRVEARDGIRTGLRHAVLLKVSAEELAFIAGPAAESAAVASIFDEYPQLQLVAVTRGRDGCALHLRRGAVFVPGFAVQTVDTTGAGDGFTAGLLFMVSEAMAGQGLSVMDREIAGEFLIAAGRFANAVGALVTTKRGGIPAMPDRAAVDELLRLNP